MSGIVLWKELITSQFKQKPYIIISLLDGHNHASIFSYKLKIMSISLQTVLLYRGLVHLALRTLVKVNQFLYIIKYQLFSKQIIG